MRCKTCNYALWNLRSRTCPECGSPFAPGDFDFVPGSVRFCCPHCNQQYYGTSPAGHLTPRTFNCVSCQAPVDMDEMVLLPAEGLSEDKTRLASNPWLTQEGSRFQRWLRTVGWALTKPGILIEGTPPESSLTPAWSFGLATYLLVAIATVAAWTMLMVAVAAAGGGGGAGAAGVMFLSLGIGLLVALLFFVVIVFAWAASAHVVLLLTGGGTKGFRRTTQAVLYSSGANVFSFVPCVQYFAWIWWVVSFGIMLRRGHGVSPARAGFAAAAAPVLGAGLVVVAYVGMIFAFMGAAGGGAWAGSQMQTAAQTGPVSTITSALIARRQRDGAWPDHGARLIEDQLGAGSFVGGLSPTSARDVTAGGVAVTELAQTPWQERAEAIDAIAAQLPEDAVAHRVGDFVFTWHGMDPDPDPRLWVVIESPPPSQIWTPATVAIGTAAGSSLPFPAAEFPAALDEQNELRAEHGLAPLWHPDTISDGRPQTAGR